MKIAIAVHGRFHAFDVARELIQRGHEVSLFTNYPCWAVIPFGIPASAVRSFWLHGLLQRVTFRRFEAALHAWFGRWAASEIRKGVWDVVICWSGIAEESFQALKESSAIKFLERGSSHIRTQADLLAQEQSRTGIHQECPSSWMISREEREYLLADTIVVPSSFAYNTFLGRGISGKKVRKNLLGVQTGAFRPEPSVVESRCRRIRSGQPLRVLYVGALSFRKGLWDLLAITRRLSGKNFQFRFLGPAGPEVQAYLAELRRIAEIIHQQPQRDLPNWYAWGDLFVLPTIEDGYAMVLDQALAGALPILATTNCAGPDLIQEGRTGWVLPIRQPDAFVERLQWCQEHREDLAGMVQRIYDQHPARDWADVAEDLEGICEEALGKGRRGT